MSVVEPARLRLVVVEAPRSRAAEAYRSLRTNLLSAEFGRGPLQHILVTSAQPREGRTTTVANLAVVMAQTGRSVLAVDADLRLPRLHALLGDAVGPGLSSYLRGETSLDDVVVPTSIPNLSLLPAGPVPENPAELIASRRTHALVEATAKRYDLVIFDSPPVLAVTDACAMAALMDAVVLIATHGETSGAALQRAREDLEDAQATIAGIVINRCNRDSDGQAAGDRDRYAQAPQVEAARPLARRSVPPPTP